jgi:transposase-like protein
MDEQKVCIYCNQHLYKLNDGMVKCSHCKKKYSPARVQKVLTLIDAFSQDKSALAISKELHISYVSVQHYYEQFRHLCAKLCEDEYEHIRSKQCSYEEYFYLERSKRKLDKAVFDARNFLTFDYEGHIYNIVMPSLYKYKQQFLADNLEDVYSREFASFKRNSRIIKVSRLQNKIERFWSFLEISILHYKGVSYEAFPFFLKEIEFKFNHTEQESSHLLRQHYYRGEENE